VHVAELWRYPIKSLAGERLESVELLPDGLPGDRMLRVVDGDGELVTARTRPRLLALDASLDGGDAPLVDGRAWDDPATHAAVTAAAGDDARLAPPAAGGHAFDESPLLVATDGAIASLGYDGRRFRPNIVIAGVDGMDERGWDGRRLRIGDGAEVDLGHLCERCVLTTFDPDTQEQDPDVLRTVNAELDGLFARNCWVVRPGRIAVGDPVELM
jgi:uncharacterized protein YcbX